MHSDSEAFSATALMASITVKDLATSMAWYQNVVGFTQGHKYERDGKLLAVSCKAGDIEILLNQDDGAKGWERQKGEGISLQFTTAQSVDALAARIKANGGTLATEPADMPWGPRVFRVVDPDGFKLSFSSVG
ncbi:MAG: VOC family protein [Gemmatimonas sp.]